MGPHVVCAIAEVVGHISVDPFGFFAAFPKSDARNAIDNAVVMPMMPLHCEHLRMIQSCWFAFKILLIIHFYRIIRIQSIHQSIIDINRRNPILSGCHDVSIIETNYRLVRVKCAGSVKSLFPNPNALYQQWQLISLSLEHFG